MKCYICEKYKTDGEIFHEQGKMFLFCDDCIDIIEEKYKANIYSVIKNVVVNAFNDLKNDVNQKKEKQHD